MFTTIIKRDGRRVPYDISKIEVAIEKAMSSVGRADSDEAKRLAHQVEERLNDKFTDSSPTIEDIQDTVEKVLMDNGFARVAKRYILYRAERTKTREMNTSLMRIYNELTFTDAIDDLVFNTPPADGNSLRVINIRERYPTIFDWLNAHNVNAAVIIIVMMVVALFNMITALPKRGFESPAQAAEAFAFLKKQCGEQKRRR